MKNLRKIALILFVSCSAFGAKNATDLAQLQKVLNKIQQAPLVEFETKRTVTSEMMGTESVYEGKLSISKKLFRWDHEKPEKSMILFDGKTFWSVTHSGSKDSKRVSVSKSNQTKMIEQQSALSLFFGNTKVVNSFKLASASQEEDTRVLQLIALQKNPQFNNLKVAYHSKKLEIAKVQFEDEIGNLTVVDFKSTNFKTKANPQLFKYAPPKGAQVTEL